MNRRLSYGTEGSEMPQEHCAEHARELLAAFEQMRERDPLPPYEEEAFSNPDMRRRVGAVIARAVEDRRSRW